MTTTPTADSSSYREVTDSNGRIYRVGETDRDIMGRPRWLMVLLPWIGMMGISVFEYAFGSAEKTLEQANGWGLTHVYWLITVWTIFEAGLAFPAGRLREKGIVTARQAMFGGAVCCLLGYLSLAMTSSYIVALIGFGVVGGTGAGFVYATCINMVGKWYPEKRGAKTGFVNGGFAYGSLPFIFLFIYMFDTSNYQVILSLVGVYMLVVVAVCGYFFKDPPKNWWPKEIDPLRWQQDTKNNRSLAKNPPAVRQYTPSEAIRTGMLPLMWICLVAIGGVSLFGINFQVPFAKEMGFGPLVVASSMGVLAVLNGVGRAFVGWISDTIGRRQALSLVLIIEGLAQFGVLWSGSIANEPLFLVFAFISGVGSGAFFPMFAALVPDYFGENNNAQNYGLVYSAKLVSGLFGGGLGGIVIGAWGYTGAYILAGFMGLFAAGLTLLLRQPGRPRKIKPNPHPISRESM